MDKLSVSVWERLEPDEQLRIKLYKNRLIAKEFAAAFARAFGPIVQVVNRVGHALARAVRNSKGDYK